MTRVPKSTNDEMQAAVDAAKQAFKSWSQTSILTRQQTMFRYQSLIRENMVSKYDSFKNIFILCLPFLGTFKAQSC